MRQSKTCAKCGSELPIQCFRTRTRVKYSKKGKEHKTTHTEHVCKFCYGKHSVPLANGILIKQGMTTEVIHLPSRATEVDKECPGAVRGFYSEDKREAFNLLCGVLSTEEALKRLRLLTAVLSGCRTRAKKSNVPFDLTLSYLAKRLIDVSFCCELTRIPFREISKGLVRSGGHWDSMSVDRIDSIAGYTKENTRLLLHQVNMFKADQTDEQMLFVAERLLTSKQQRMG